MTTLYVRDSTGFRTAEPREVLERAHALLAQRYRTGSPALTSPALTREFLRMRLAGCDREIFGLVLLDARHRVIAVKDLFYGTIDRASVHPREVVKAVLDHRASAAIAYHNHVSGQSSPSHADETITRHLQQTLALLDVSLLDHLIIADPIFSFAESGRL
jgi:DNA repair protein RadC